MQTTTNVGSAWRAADKMVDDVPTDEVAKLSGECIF
jgi:hypothetical protein